MFITHILILENHLKVFKYSFWKEVPKYVRYFTLWKFPFFRIASGPTFFIRFDTIVFRYAFKTPWNIFDRTFCKISQYFLAVNYFCNSLHLLCRSMDWFLYDNGFCHERVKYLTRSWTCLWIHVFKWSKENISC